jgi:hypothetical protein
MKINPLILNDEDVCCINQKMCVTTMAFCRNCAGGYENPPCLPPRYLKKTGIDADLFIQSLIRVNWWIGANEKDLII